MKLYKHNGKLIIQDPEGWYDWDSLVEEWKDRLDELPELEVDLKPSYLASIESRKDPIMSEGFSYQGKQIRADSEAQANLTAWIVRDGRGGLTYPKHWILANGDILQINSTEELDAFADAFESFKESVYTAIITAKAQIATASAEQAKVIFDNWESSIAT